jgi:hypothetical protein
MTDPRQSRIDYNDPDRQNREQADEQAQAQAYAEAARHDAYHERASEGSDRDNRPDPTLITPDDTQDVVDHMTDMDHGGRIDMNAYAGEPESMDDEDGTGQTGAPEESRHPGSGAGVGTGADTVSDEALKRGLTPGEMMASEEPEETTRLPDADGD